MYDICMYMFLAAVIVVPPEEQTTASSLALIGQMETEIDDNEGEDLYENVLTKSTKQKSHAILLDDIISYVMVRKKDNCAGFKTEYKVGYCMEWGC
jgi:hypothetical protein